MDQLLSDRLEQLRVWWASYAHDGVELLPEVVAALTSTMSDLVKHAGEYEELMRSAHQFLVAVRHDDRRTGRPSIDRALAAKGLSGTVWPAAAMLTDAQLADPKIALFPGRRVSQDSEGVAS